MERGPCTTPEPDSMGPGAPASPTLLSSQTRPHLTQTHTHTHQGTLLSFLGRRIWAAGREGTSISGRNLPPDPELTGGAQRYRNPGNDLLSVSNLCDPDHGFQGLPSSFLLISFNRHPLPVDTRGPARIRVAREAHLYLCKDGWVWEPLEVCKPLHRWVVAFSEIRGSDTSPLSEWHSRRAQGRNSMLTSLAGSLHQRPSKQRPWAPLGRQQNTGRGKGGRHREQGRCREGRQSRASCVVPGPFQLFLFPQGWSKAQTKVKGYQIRRQVRQPLPCLPQSLGGGTRKSFT